MKMGAGRPAETETATDSAADVPKLKDLAHYVIWRAADDDGCAAIKLFQVLWCAEINNYVRSGQLISGVRYVRTRHGLRPICWDEIRSKLVEEGAIRRPPEAAPDQWTETYSAIRPPRGLPLSRAEIALLDFWIDKSGEFLGGRPSAVFGGVAR